MTLEALTISLLWSASKGIVLCWGAPGPIPFIERVEIGFPFVISSLIFFRQVIGHFWMRVYEFDLFCFFALLYYLSGSEEAATPAGGSSTKAFVDFNADSLPQANEPTLNQTDQGLELINPMPSTQAGGDLNMGLQGPWEAGINFLVNPQVIGGISPRDSAGDLVPSGLPHLPRDFAMDVPIDIEAVGGQSLHLDKLLLIGAKVLPHIPLGTFGDLTVTSFIDVSNPGGIPNDIEIEFFTQAGLKIGVDVDGNGTAMHRVTVAPETTIRLELTRDNNLRVFWAFISGSEPFESTVIYRTVSGASVGTAGAGGGTFVGEAGVSAADVNHIYTFGVNVLGSSSTSFAAVNPTGQDATVTFTLTDSNDQLVGNVQ